MSHRPISPFAVQAQRSRRAPVAKPQQVRRAIAPQPQQQRRRVRQQPTIDFRSIFDVNEYNQAPSAFVGLRAGEFCNTPDYTEGVCLSRRNNC